MISIGGVKAFQFDVGLDIIILRSRGRFSGAWRERVWGNGKTGGFRGMVK